MRVSAAAAVFLAAGSLGAAPRQPDRRAEAVKDRRAEALKQFDRGEGRLKPGDPAPDFRLQRLHSSQVVSLAGFRGKRPVALVFGSFT